MPLNLDRFLLSAICLLFMTGFPFGAQNKISPADSGSDFVPPVFRVIIKPGAGVDSTRLHHAYQSSGLRVTARIAKMGMDVCEITAPGSIASIRQAFFSAGLAQCMELDRPIFISRIPNDPYFRYQWGLENKEDHDVDAPEAWSVFHPRRKKIIVGVIDTGLDFLHEDLRDAAWINEDEIAGNSIDDDGNGFVDDTHGWDFFNNRSQVADVSSHGTHVAGIIAAARGNAKGIAGVDGDIQIMPVKFIHSYYGYTSDAIRAIEYAVENGAQVLNASWGGGDSSQALADAIAWAGERGVLFVAAAGNWGVSNDQYPFYPASFGLPNLLAVAATNSGDSLAGFSNYGVNSVHLAAPGETILSTIPGNQYAFYSGTSMAAPFVSAAAAVLLSYQPRLPASRAVSALIQASDSLTSLEGKLANARRINVRSVALPLPIPKNFGNYLYYLLSLTDF